MTEKDIAKILVKGERKYNLVKAINTIPKEQLSMYFSAYQSSLWNKSLKRILFQYIENPFKVKGKIMNYYFYQNLDESTLNELKQLSIPTVSYKIPGSCDIVENVLEVLKERGLKPSDFNLTKIRKSFFKSFFRPAIIFPEDFKTFPLEEDDIYPGYLKLKLNFTLRPGSFATMLIKALQI